MSLRNKVTEVCAKQGWGQQVWGQPALGERLPNLPRSAWRLAVIGVVAVAVSAVLFVAFAAGLVPRVLGGNTLRVTGDALLPDIANGEVIVVRGIASAEVCPKVNTQQIVAYMPMEGSSKVATGRVTAKSVGQFSDGTKCRFNLADNSISPNQVRGTLLYKVPGLGPAQDWAKGNMALASGAAGTLLIGAWAATNNRKNKVIDFSNSGRHLKTATLTKPNTKLNNKPKQTTITKEVTAQPETKPDIITPPPVINRLAILQKREAQLFEHEFALREARLAYRESCLNQAPSQGRHLRRAAPPPEV